MEIASLIAIFWWAAPNLKETFEWTSWSQYVDHPLQYLPDDFFNDSDVVGGMEFPGVQGWKCWFQGGYRVSPMIETENCRIFIKER